jgi:hypothetical protein
MGSIGQINNQIRSESANNLDGARRIVSGNEECKKINSFGGERDKSGNNRAGSMSFFGQQQKIKAAKKS